MGGKLARGRYRSETSHYKPCFGVLSHANGSIKNYIASPLQPQRRDRVDVGTFMSVSIVNTVSCCMNIQIFLTHKLASIHRKVSILLKFSLLIAYFSNFLFLLEVTPRQNR